MNGVKMSDCRFYVNEEERTVICVIPNTREMLVDFILEHFVWDSIDFWRALGGRFYRVDLKMPHSFVGKAVCAEGDEWNEETGRMIAFSRAKDKCYKSFFKRANKFVQAVDEKLGEMIELFNAFGLKLETKRQALQDQIDARVQTEE